MSIVLMSDVEIVSAELALVRQLNQKKYGTDPEGWEEPPRVYRLDPR